MKFYQKSNLSQKITCSVEDMNTMTSLGTKNMWKIDTEGNRKTAETVKKKKRKNKLVELGQKREGKNKTIIREKSYFESNKTSENTFRNIEHRSEEIT